MQTRREPTVASTPLALELPLYTRHPDDFRHLGELLDVVAV
jgi:hypothetical protein